MEELLLEVRPNANKKYYLFIADYLKRLVEKEDSEIETSVNDLIEGTSISRPTFYSYFSGLEEFYRELAVMFFQILPGYMAKKSQELKTDDFLELAFNLRIGMAINNIKKSAGIFSSITPYWKNYYSQGMHQIAAWYVRDFDMDEESATMKARFVLNELVLHPNLYYNDFGTYQSLMKNQRIVKQVA